MQELKKLDLINIFGEEYIQKLEKKFPIFFNPDVRQWIRDKVELYKNKGKDPKKFSISTLLKILTEYCQYCEIDNPSELLEENVDDRSARVLRYLEALIQQGRSNASVRNSLQGIIRSFFTYRGAPLKKTTLPTVSKGDNEDEEVLDAEKIKMIDARLGARYGLIMSFQALFGLRVNDVLQELVSSKNGQDQPKYRIEKHENHFYVKNFFTVKEGVYINYLFFPKELITQLIAVVDDITCEKDLIWYDCRKLFKTRPNKQGIRNTIDSKDYLKALKHAGKEAGLKGNIKSHALRKFFSGMVVSCTEVPDKFRDHMLGHKIPLDTYLNRLELIQIFYGEWKKIEKKICIKCELIDITNVEIVKHKKEINDLKQQIDILIKENSEKDKKVEDLSSKMDKILVFIGMLEDIGIIDQDNEEMKEKIRNATIKKHEEENKLE